MYANNNSGCVCCLIMRGETPLSMQAADFDRRRNWPEFHKGALAVHADRLYRQFQVRFAAASELEESEAVRIGQELFDETAEAEWKVPLTMGLTEQVERQLSGRHILGVFAYDLAAKELRIYNGTAAGVPSLQADPALRLPLDLPDAVRDAIFRYAVPIGYSIGTHVSRLERVYREPWTLIQNVLDNPDGTLDIPAKLAKIAELDTLAKKGWLETQAQANLEALRLGNPLRGRDIGLHLPDPDGEGGEEVLLFTSVLLDSPENEQDESKQVGLDFHGIPLDSEKITLHSDRPPVTAIAKFVTKAREKGWEEKLRTLAKAQRVIGQMLRVDTVPEKRWNLYEPALQCAFKHLNRLVSDMPGFNMPMFDESDLALRPIDLLNACQEQFKPHDTMFPLPFPPDGVPEVAYRDENGNWSYTDELGLTALTARILKEEQLSGGQRGGMKQLRETVWRVLYYGQNAVAMYADRPGRLEDVVFTADDDGLLIARWQDPSTVRLTDRMPWTEFLEKSQEIFSDVREAAYYLRENYGRQVVLRAGLTFIAPWQSPEVQEMAKKLSLEDGDKVWRKAHLCTVPDGWRYLLGDTADGRVGIFTGPSLDEDGEKDLKRLYRELEGQEPICVLN